MAYVHLRHSERVESDPKFRYLAETARLDFAGAEKTSISLLESHRRAARIAQESLYQRAKTEYHEALDLTNEPENTDEVAEEAVLTETSFILADMIIGSVAQETRSRATD